MTFDQYQRFKVIREHLKGRGFRHSGIAAAVSPDIGWQTHDPVTNDWLDQAQAFLDGERESLPEAGVT